MNEKESNSVTPQNDRKSASNGNIILILSCHLFIYFLMTEMVIRLKHVKLVGPLSSNIAGLKCSTAAMR